MHAVLSMKTMVKPIWVEQIQLLLIRMFVEFRLCCDIFEQWEVDTCVTSKIELIS